MRAKGFNLIEIIMITGITVILASLSIAAYTRILVLSKIDEFTDQTKQTLRLASAYSRAGYLDSDYGVYFDRGGSGERLIFYKGASYESRDSAYDRIETFSEHFISMTTLAMVGGESFDINFSEYTGVPDNTGNIVISQEGSGERIITIDNLGIVTQQ
jgi:hypothetical protein